MPTPVLVIIKDCLKKAKEEKKVMVLSMSKKKRRVEKQNIFTEEVNRTISSLEAVFFKDLILIPDDDDIRRMKELSEHNKTLQTMPKTIENLIDS